MQEIPWTLEQLELFAQALCSATRDVEQAAASLGLPPLTIEQLEDAAASMGLARCESCERWTEASDLLDDEGEPAFCEDCQPRFA